MSQDNKTGKIIKGENERNWDSIYFVDGVNLYKEGNIQEAKKNLVNVFVTKYSNWHDSAYNFLSKKNKLNWIKEFSPVNIKGYSLRDSLFYIVGKNLFLNNQWQECREYFQNCYITFNKSIYSDSSIVLTKKAMNILDSITLTEKLSKKLTERRWVYIGDFFLYDKFGKVSENSYETYYDINNLLYEGDSVFIVMKVGNYLPSYRFICVNLNSNFIHGIDASSYFGVSYSFIWDGDWWRDTESDFMKEIIKLLVKKN